MSYSPEKYRSGPSTGPVIFVSFSQIPSWLISTMSLQIPYPHHTHFWRRWSEAVILIFCYFSLICFDKIASSFRGFSFGETLFCSPRYKKWKPSTWSKLYVFNSVLILQDRISPLKMYGESSKSVLFWLSNNIDMVGLPRSWKPEISLKALINDVISWNLKSSWKSIDIFYIFLYLFAQKNSIRIPTFFLNHHHFSKNIRLLRAYF